MSKPAGVGWWQYIQTKQDGKAKRKKLYGKLRDIDYLEELMEELYDSNQYMRLHAIQFHQRANGDGGNKELAELRGEIREHICNAFAGVVRLHERTEQILEEGQIDKRIKGDC